MCFIKLFLYAISPLAIDVHGFLLKVTKSSCQNFAHDHRELNKMGTLLSNVQDLEYVCSEISFVMKGVWRLKFRYES